MKQNNKSHIMWRYALIIGFTLVFVVLIVGQLVRTTIVDAPHWNERAHAMTSVLDTIPPERGRIFADNGTVLAATVEFKTARIDFRAAKFSEKEMRMYLPMLCDSLAAMFPNRSAARWRELLEAQLNKDPKKRSRAYPIAPRLTKEEYERVASFPYFRDVRRDKVIYADSDPRRRKPYGKMAARSIGNVAESTVSGKVFYHGSSGLEKSLDSLLFGEPGLRQRIPLTNRIDYFPVVPAKPGWDVTTTINVEIQDILEEELYNMCVETNSQWATAVLMEVQTGEIKAISNLEWKDEVGDYIETTNNAVMGYEPGSVMKPISMLVALEDGIVSDPEQIIVTGKSWSYAGGKPITDSHGMGSMPVRRVIESSSNVGMAKIIVKKYGDNPRGFRDRLAELGFFEPLHTGIAGEQVPYVAVLGNKNWDKIALSRMAYGYTTRIPPMCTLAVYNAIANDGRYIRPHLVKKLSRQGSPDSVLYQGADKYIREQLCRPENAAMLRAMLYDVVWGEYGTAKVLRDDRVKIAGKTGTCYDIIGGAYNPGKKRLAFCGFFPYEKPKYSCIVLMSHADRGAARCSGMVLKNVALKLYSRGLLDNSSNFRDEKRPGTYGKRGVMYALAARPNFSGLYIKSDGLARYEAPKTMPDTLVPSVIGMGLDEAVNTLERRGINVGFTGVGYVAGQSIKPGSHFKAGDKIMLTLKN